MVLTQDYILSAFCLKFSGLAKLQAESGTGGGTENPTQITTNKNICNNCRAVNPLIGYKKQQILELDVT